MNATTFAAGQSILFQGGSSFTGSVTIANRGSSARPITIGSYGSGKATNNGCGGTAIYVYNAGNVNVTNLTLIGSWNSSSRPGNTGYGIR